MRISLEQRLGVPSREGLLETWRSPMKPQGAKLKEPLTGLFSFLPRRKQSALIQLSYDLGRIETNSPPQLNELDDVNAALPGLHVRHP